MRKFKLFFLGIISFVLLTGFDFDVIQERLGEGDRLILDKKYDDAEETFNQILQEVDRGNPSPQEELAKNIVIPEIYFKLGEIQYNQGEHEDAKSYFEKVVGLQFASYWDVKAFYNIGLIDYELKKYDEARSNFARVVDEYPDSEEAAQAQYYIGLSYELEDNKEEAKGAFRKFINLFPEHPWLEKVKIKL